MKKNLSKRDLIDRLYELNEYYSSSGRTIGIYRDVTWKEVQENYSDPEYDIPAILCKNCGFDISGIIDWGDSAGIYTLSYLLSTRGNDIFPIHERVAGKDGVSQLWWHWIADCCRQGSIPDYQNECSVLDDPAFEIDEEKSLNPLDPTNVYFI